MQRFYFCIYFFCLPSTAFILCTCACVAASAVCSSVARGNLVNCHLTLSSWSHGAAFLGGFLDPCNSSLLLPGVGMPFATRVSENVLISCSEWDAGSTPSCEVGGDAGLRCAAGCAGARHQGWRGQQLGGAWIPLGAPSGGGVHLLPLTLFLMNRITAPARGFPPLVFSLLSALQN